MPKKVTIPAMELWDEKNECFVTVKEQTLTLEHSLISISKWESKWKKPFIGRDGKTTEELLDYCRCMTLNPNVSPEVYYCIPPSILQEIADYIEDTATATKFFDKMDQTPNRETITSELIYYWMDTLNIPSDREKWHLNKLIALIRVHGLKSSKPKPMTAAERRALNKARQNKHHTRG